MSNDSLSTAASTPSAAAAGQAQQQGVIRTLSDINPLYGRLRMDSDQSADLPLEYDGEPASLPVAPPPLVPQGSHSSLVGGLSLTSEELLPPVRMPSEVRGSSTAGAPCTARCSQPARDAQAKHGCTPGAGLAGQPRSHAAAQPPLPPLPHPWP
jgi:hypothetical protein